MTTRVPLFQLMHTPEGDRMDAYTELYEAVGITVDDEIRGARGPQPRDTRQTPHEFGDCVRGASRCPIHRREYRQDLEERRATQRRAEQERAARVAAMNQFRMAEIHGAKVRKAQVDAR